MRIAIAQIDTILGDVEKNLSKIEHYTDKAIEEKCDLIVFPELALTGYGLRDLVYSVSVNVEDSLFESLKEKSGFIDISFGFAQKESGYFYNSAVYLSESNVLTVHKKKYLPDYGMFEEERYFAPGDSIETFKTKFGNTTMLICEDAFHISAHYEAFKNETDFMIVLSASPFWSDSESMKWEMWENTCKTSAQLNGYFVAFVNRVGFEDGVGFFGKSFLVSPFGNVIKEASLFKEEMLLVEIDLKDIERARIKMPIKKNEALR
ncbi:nitrilase-related carbon-nitrogen hydrolase [Hippea alviniae]|uniref:nitrilase-related carbon-nitrogen hydrolase n=1 Tax=Hippea alviniae TaxID=1279027 RepID=UPI0003B37B19|nr:nitrilase-related carbon-nitrogen hydrolase [Hippea alviniae]